MSRAPCARSSWRTDRWSKRASRCCTSSRAMPRRPCRPAWSEDRSSACTAVAGESVTSLHDIFHQRLPIIAPLALRPLPGSPRYGGRLDAVIEQALADLTVLEAGGVGGVCCENLGDAPF